MGKLGRHILVIIATALLLLALLGLPACGKASTTTMLTSSQNPSTYGESVTFTAVVSDTSGTPTGTVQFKIDGTNWGGPVTLSAGSATSNATSTLSVGNHTITAVYSGDISFAASTSIPLTQTVNQGATTSAWSAMSRPTTGPLSAVWGSSATDVFAVGNYYNSGYGIILHYNGSEWSAMSSPTTGPLSAVWGSSATDVFAMGNYYNSGYGIILHYS